MEVTCLGADEAWDLFREKVGEVTLESHPDIPALARIVVERCRGSPLAVSVIGVAMAGKSLVQEWRYAIDALTLSAAKFSGMEDEILPVLKFSYDSLKDERVKLCFQYCALFRKGEHIWKDHLVEYWVDEGIIDGKEDRYRAEEECYDIIRYLVRACLLADDKHGNTVSMPSLARELALWVASNFGEEKENFIVKPNEKLGEVPNVKDWGQVSRMSLSENKIKKISCSPVCPKLRTLLLGYNNLEKISSGFFMYIKQLPLASLKELKRLQHLNLEFTGFLKEIAGISSLSNLQVLKLYASFDLDINLVEELQLLKHLKVLTVSGGDAYVWEQLMSNPRLASCTRNMYFYECEAGETGISIAATSSRLEDLTIYESNIREIKIDQSSPKTMCNFQFLVKVEISECQGLQDLTWLLFAPNLGWLDVRESPQIEEIISEEKAARFMNGEATMMPFLKLKHLDLAYLDQLSSIYWSPLSFPCLMKISIFGCPNLWKLPLGSSSANGCNLVIHGEEEWIEELQWDEEGTKEQFTLKGRKSEPVAAYPQNQSELELLRKRVVDLEEENRSIKQRLERIERFLWQQQQLQQARAHQQPTTGMLPPQTVIHQQRQSQRTLPDMPSKKTPEHLGVSEQFEKSKKLKEWIAGGPDYTFLEYEKPSQTTFNINFMK
ncbi:BnaA09g17850D [Brassica napus]|uniref:BnaA09g17850D protein n=1 Tax=Brassica napus TaxID=3708 RepID=A0A078HEB7_BRANA|nr:BnaA09g17850D [Brassica napus]